MKALLALVFVFALIINSIWHSTDSIWMPQSQKIPAPVLLDDIHYYVSDRKAAEEFFIEHFAARVMPHPQPRPLQFITFLSLRQGEGTINISPRGPFPGIRLDDPNQWNQEVTEPSEDLPPVYGVYWLGIRSGALNQTLTRLEIEGVRVAQRMLSLPHDILARAAMIEGPDWNQIALVERKQQSRPNAEENAVWGDFGIDHLLLLVKSMKDNETFFRDLFGGSVVMRRNHLTTMKVAGTMIILVEPEALALKRETVQPRDPKKFRYGIDHIGFLYADLKPAVELAKAKGYTFLREPATVNYYDEPTAYTLAIILSPDGLQCQMVQENGRARARTVAPQK